jgi:hypothetical protein
MTFKIGDEVIIRGTVTSQDGERIWVDVDGGITSINPHPRKVCILMRQEVIEPTRWQPFETAPTDDTPFLAGTDDGSGRVLIWRGSVLANARLASTTSHISFPATHWMQVPLPPKTGAA